MTLQVTYIICSTMRSGSTLLSDLLTSTKLVGKPQEFFLPKWEEKSKFDSTNYPDYVYKMLESFAASTGISGVKLMWCNLDIMLSRLRKFNTNLHISDLELLQEVFPDLKFIFISRRHKARQAISLARSIQTNSWNKYKDPESGGKVLFNKYGNLVKKHKNYPFISPGSIHLQLSNLLKDEENWISFFQKYDIVPHTITYEELAEKQVLHVSQILEFLGVEMPQDAQVKSSFAKQADIYTEILLWQYHIYYFLLGLLPNWIVQLFERQKTHLKSFFRFDLQNN